MFFVQTHNKGIMIPAHQSTQYGRITYSNSIGEILQIR